MSREPKAITEMFAWVVEEADGGEGIPASSRLVLGHLVPLLGADRERVNSLRAEARYISDLVGRPVKLVRFAGPPEVLEHYAPGEP